MARRALSVGLIAGAALGAAALYAHGGAAPSCDSEQALGKVYGILRSQFQLASILLNNVTVESGGFFSDSRDCSAEVARIKGDADMVHLSWQQIRYQIVLRDASQAPVVTVQLGDRVPFAPPAPSLWTRLLDRF